VSWKSGCNFFYGISTVQPGAPSIGPTTVQRYRKEVQMLFTSTGPTVAPSAVLIAGQTHEFQVLVKLSLHPQSYQVLIKR
jgi:hypothetical protein